MTMYGANPEQLASLGRSLQHQITSIEGVVSAVSSACLLYTSDAADE